MEIAEFTINNQKDYILEQNYKKKPEYADGMIAAYSAMHDELMEKTAEVRAMIEGYK